MRAGKALRTSQRKREQTARSRQLTPPRAKSRRRVALIVPPKITKQTQMIAMLRQEPGVSIATIAAATGWQRHSVRGFFAAVVKKRLGFDLAYRKSETGERLYRIEILSGRSSSQASDHVS